MQLWADIGSYALNLSAVVALVQCVPALIAGKQLRIQQLTVQASRIHCLLLTLSFISLVISFYNNDFSVLYVAEHSNTLLPWYYRLSATWGGHEGSLLLWVWILSIWTCVLAYRTRTLLGIFRARVLAVLSYISLGFILFIILTSNPFNRLSFVPVDGLDLNPLLQDPGLILHPPLLYTGYVGFSVAFAFIVAGLWHGRVDRIWLHRVRPWTLAAWIALTLGIALGSYWAYYELGWGGWWFWDPVENASFMPWLLGSALIHVLSVAEKRGLFRIWVALLAISTFALSLIGTFLVRSGVLTSIHAFASDPSRGIFIIGLLIAITLPALLLLIQRANVIQQQVKYSLLSRETGILLNNWLLSGACFVVLLGTLYPLAADVLNIGKISVGAPYFNRFIVPLALILLIVLGIGPLLRWRHDSPSRLIPFLLFNLFFASVMTLLSAIYVLPTQKNSALIALFSAFFALGAVLVDYIQAIAKRGIRAIRPQAAIAGMFIAHSGFIIMTLAVTMTSLYSIERDIPFSVSGKEVTLKDYRLVLSGLRSVKGENYQATEGRFIVENLKNDNIVTLTPTKRTYFSSAAPLTESARHITLTHDLYLAMGEQINSDTWAVRVQYKPFIIWIWLGGIMMALGAAFAACDRSYRMK